MILGNRCLRLVCIVISMVLVHFARAGEPNSKVLEWAFTRRPVANAASGTLVLTGTVKDDTGKIIPDATLVAEASFYSARRDDRKVQTATDANGSYRMVFPITEDNKRPMSNGMAPYLTVTLEAKSPSLIPTTIILDDTKVTSFTVVLPTPRSIRGKLQGPGWEAWRRQQNVMPANLSVLTRDHWNRWIGQGIGSVGVATNLSVGVATNLVNDDGTFRVDEVPPGPVVIYPTPGLKPREWMIIAEAPSSGTVYHIPHGAAKAAVQFLNGHTSTPLAGLRLRWRQSAVSAPDGHGGAQDVELPEWFPPESSGEVVTDAEGKTSVSASLPGAVTFSWNGQRPGNWYCTRNVPMHGLCTATLTRDAKDLSVVELYDGWLVHGRVTEKGTTTPVANAVVRITSLSTETRTAENGWFRFESIPDSLMNVSLLHVDVSHPDYGSMVDEEEWRGGRDFDVFGNRVKRTVRADMELVRSPSVRGRVIDEATSRPMVGVAVELAVASSKRSGWGRVLPTVETKTDDEGRYKIPVALGTVGRVQATPRDRAPVYSQTVRGREGPDTELPDLVVPATDARLEGAVIHPDGSAASGAKVRARVEFSGATTNWTGESSALSAPLPEVVSDVEGRFSLNVPRQRADLKLTADLINVGLSPSSEVALRPEGPSPTSVTLQLEPLATLKGRVIDGTTSAPAPEGSTVMITTPDAGIGQTQTTLDREGRFVFENLRIKPVTVMVFAGAKTRNSWEYFVDTPVGQGEVTLVLGKGQDTPFKQRTSQGDLDKGTAKLIGTVVDWKTGEAITDFTVSSPGRAINVTMRKDAPGMFEAEGFRAGYSYSITISAKGYAPYEAGSIVIPPGTPQIERTFKVGPGGKITGRVVDAKTKAPIAKVTVTLNMVQAAGATSAKNPNTTTDDDGRFELAGAGSGIQSVQFEGPKPYVGFSQSARVVYNEVTDMGDVPMGQGGAIVGRLVRMPGEVPVPNSRITINSRRLSVLSGAKGEFEFRGLQTGMYFVEAPDAGANAWAGVENLEEKEVILRVGAGEFRGTVLRKGKPYRATAMMRQINYGQSVTRNSRTGADGVFVVDALAPGQWEVLLTAVDDGSRTLSQMVTMPANGDNQTATFNFQSSALSVMVTDGAGKPVDGASVVARRRASGAVLQPNPIMGTTGGDGLTQLDGLEPGTYDVVAEKTGKGRGESEPVTLAGDGSAAQADIVLADAKGGTVQSVALSMTDGRGIPTAWLYLYKSNGLLWEHRGQRDETGTMIVEGVPPGRYRAQVSALGYAVAEHEIDVKTGQTTRLDDVLYQAGALRWALRRMNGETVPGLLCNLDPIDAGSIETPRSGATNKDGVFIVRGLFPGAYEARAQLSGGRTVKALVKIYANNVTDTMTTVDQAETTTGSAGSGK